jgi:hypothetical protein
MYIQHGKYEGTSGNGGSDSQAYRLAFLILFFFVAPHAVADGAPAAGAVVEAVLSSSPLLPDPDGWPKSKTVGTAVGLSASLAGPV